MLLVVVVIKFSWQSSLSFRTVLNNSSCVCRYVLRPGQKVRQWARGNSCQHTLATNTIFRLKIKDRLAYATRNEINGHQVRGKKGQTLSRKLSQ